MDKITRREFLKFGGAAAVAVGATAAASRGLRQEVEPSVQNAALLDEQLVRTTCAMCPSGCGLEVRVVDGKAVKIEGNALHPLNQGVCCLKGQAALEALYSPERLAHPMVRKGGRNSRLEEVSWDEALRLVAARLQNLRRLGQSHTVALLHGETRGQMRSTLERFMTAYGSPNLIGKEGLGEGVVRQVLFLSQGLNALPTYDLNNASYVISFGGNLLESSRNVIAHLGALAFMRRGRPQRGKLVSVHPRLSATGLKADEWIPIRPGTYGALALGLANVIINSDLYDVDFVRNYTFGFEDFTDANGMEHKGFKTLVLERYDLERVSSITGVPTDIIARLAGEFAANRPAIAVLPTEMGEFAAGNSLYSALAVHALNALVGSIDTPGGVLVQRFPEPKDWPDYEHDGIAEQSLEKPRIDGAGSSLYPIAISCIQKFPTAVLAESPYPINAALIMNANPVYEMPDGGRWAQALQKIPFVVSFSPVLDETAAHADVILPASTFLEVWEDDYLEGTGYAGISLRRPIVEPVHDTRSAGDAILSIAGLIEGPVKAAFPWKDYEGLVRYRLSGVDMEWEKVEENGCWSEMIYFHAEPGSRAWERVVGRDRITAPKDGRFDFFSRELFTLLGNPSDEEACLPHFNVPTTLEGDPGEEQDFPLLLVSQDIFTNASAWQGILPTMLECYGLQSNSKWTSFVEVSPKVAEALRLHEGDPVWVESKMGRVQAEVRLYEGLWPNAVFLPPGLGHSTQVRWGRHSPESMTVGENRMRLAIPGVESLSGALISSPVRVRIYKV